ncbi:MAG: hypothetical protein NUW37_19810 [Planctomycetes bacterium]|nr:hypothetical protein [Planctomycetota bacterium]
MAFPEINTPSSSMSLDKVRLPEEKKLAEELAPETALSRRETARPGVSAGVESSWKLTPRIEDLRTRFSKVFALTTKPRIVIASGPTRGLSFESSAKNAEVSISGELLNSLGDRELMFVVGFALAFSELLATGPSAYFHGCAPDRSRAGLSSDGWSKLAVLSADRAGLLFCQDYSLAVKAMLQASTGLSGKYKDDLGAYFTDLRDAPQLPAEFPETGEDWDTLHPFHPVRLRALKFFAEGEVASSLLDVSRARFTNAQSEAHTQRLSSIFDVRYLVRLDEQSKTIRNFQLWAAVYFLSASGTMSREGIVTVARALGAASVEKGVDVFLKSEPEQIKDRYFKTIPSYIDQVQRPRRSQLLRDLAALVLDSPLTSAKVETLESIASDTEVPSSVALQIQAAAHQRAWLSLQ